MIRSLTSAAVVALLTVSTTSAMAQQIRPDQHVRARQSVMFLQNRYIGQIRPMAQGKVPYDAKLVMRNIGYLDSLSRMPWEHFVPETKGEKSRATAAVFTDTAKFNQARDSFAAEMSKLVEVSRKGDENAIKGEILAVDKSCNSCHDTFRERN